MKLFKNGYVRRLSVMLLTLTFIFTGITTINIPEVNASDNPIDTTLNAKVTVAENPPSITISWTILANTVSSYEVYRKGLNDKSWGNTIQVLDGSALSFTDSNVEIGKGYEYYINAVNTVTVMTTYIYTGIKLPASERRGKVILLFDNALKYYLLNEVNTLVFDLIGDGWDVVRHDIERTNSVQDVKALIKADYEADPLNVKSVFILGHIAVPKSSELSPDGHEPRPFPADCYYGDMTGEWTDNIDFPIYPGYPTNLKGDGIFDQSAAPNEIQLEVGRVDCFYMIGSNLLRDQASGLKIYLDKDHNYRQKITNAPNEAFIDDPWQNGAGASGSNLWRNLSPILDNGYQSVVPGVWADVLPNRAFQWGFVCGPGSPNGVQLKDGKAVITTDMLLRNTYKVNFLMAFGSYFCEWDIPNNFLRAPLFMKEYGLECMWTGGNWFIQSLGMGTTFGYGMKNTINNNYTNLYRPTGYSGYGVQTALMGDPTLRLFQIAPPTNQKLNIVDGRTTNISWDASTDSVLGYYVYRAYENSPFIRITDLPIISTNYTDSGVPPGNVKYMIRAMRLETTRSGSYYNLSQGAFAPTIPVITPTPKATKTPTPTPTSMQTPTLTPTPTAPPATSTPTPTVVLTPIITFPDLESVEWAREAIMNLVSLNVIKGYEDGTFKPDNNITRAEFTKMLTVSFGIYDPNATSSFKDLPANEWYISYIGSAEKENLAKGSGDGKFSPDLTITREEMFTFCARAIEKYKNYVTLTNDSSEIQEQFNKFVDADTVSDWAIGTVATCIKYGLITGAPVEGGGKAIHPTDAITRAEVAVALNRTIKLQDQ